MNLIDEIIIHYKEIENRPCVDEYETQRFGSMDRLDYIESELAESNSPYKVVAGKKGYYKLYAQDSLESLARDYSEIYLVSAHADNKQSNSSFEEPKDGIVHGCGDNASTLAVSLVIMQKCTLSRNILFVATADEENKNDSKGAKKVAKKLRKLFPEPGAIKAITLDVTYGYHNGADFTFENDFIRPTGNGHAYISSVFEILNNKGYHWDAILCKDESNDNGKYVTVDEIKKYMGSGCKQCNENGEYNDESAEYDDKKCSAFSFCLPCSAKDNDEMHDPKGFDIKMHQYERYASALIDILQTLSAD